MSFEDLNGDTKGMIYERIKGDADTVIAFSRVDKHTRKAMPLAIAGRLFKLRVKKALYGKNGFTKPRSRSSPVHLKKPFYDAFRLNKKERAKMQEEYILPAVIAVLVRKRLIPDDEDGDGFYSRAELMAERAMERAALRAEREALRKRKNQALDELAKFILDQFGGIEAQRFRDRRTMRRTSSGKDWA